MGERWTIRSMAKWMAEDFASRDLPSPRLDAELLLAHALGCGRMALYLDLDRPLQTGDLDAVRALVQRRRANEPVAYILGEREFVGRPFFVSPAVLIPRPDTETLVDRALQILGPGGVAAVADVCTGSGCIAVTLAAARPSSNIHATDISPEAIQLAARNAERHGVAERVALHEGDLFNALPAGARYDLLCCNPPYVTEAEWAELDADVRDHEPRLALVGGPDGLDFYRRIADGAPERLANGGTLLVEVGQGQAAAVAALFEQAGLQDARIHDDLGGIPRVVEARRSPAKQQP